MDRVVNENSWVKQFERLILEKGFTVEYVTVGTGADTCLETRATGMIGNEQISVLMSVDVNGQLRGKITENGVITSRPINYKQVLDFIRKIARHFESGGREWDGIVEMLRSHGFVEHPRDQPIENAEFGLIRIVSTKFYLAKGLTSGNETMVVALVKGYKMRGSTGKIAGYIIVNEYIHQYGTYGDIGRMVEGLLDGSVNGTDLRIVQLQDQIRAMLGSGYLETNTRVESMRREIVTLQDNRRNSTRDVPSKRIFDSLSDATLPRRS